jgi:uncharacterized damage-inducible protein DinB
VGEVEVEMKVGEGRDAAGAEFLRQSRRYLKGEYLPKIRRAVHGLSEEDLWWRPNPRSNSIGNLILHLAGNARQWVVAGIGQELDTRDRQAEFDGEGGLSGEELLDHLSRTLEVVDGVLAELSPEVLQEERVIQGLHTTVLGALFHVVEHFSMHTGQILYISKLRGDRDLGFYRVRGGEVEINW